MANHQPLAQDSRDYWSYYLEYVHPLVRQALISNLPESSELRMNLDLRMSSEARFRAGEALYWLLRDSVSGVIEETPAAWGRMSDVTWRPAAGLADIFNQLLAAAEMLSMARLTRDDVLDRHEFRQHFRTLASEFGVEGGLVAAEVLGVSAIEMVSAVEGSPDIRVRLMDAFLLYRHRVSRSEDFELSFAQRGNMTGPVQVADYLDLLRRKHGLGSLYGDIYIALSATLPKDELMIEQSPEHGTVLKVALRDWDVFGGVFNDWSEISLRRGQGWDEMPQVRGTSEIGLVRPTLLNAFLGSPLAVDQLLGELGNLGEWSRICSNLPQVDGRLRRHLGLFAASLLSRDYPKLLGGTWPNLERHLASQRARRLERLRVEAATEA